MDLCFEPVAIMQSALQLLEPPRPAREFVDVLAARLLSTVDVDQFLGRFVVVKDVRLLLNDLWSVV